MAQMTFSDIEYGKRKNPTRRDRFLTAVNAEIPWDEWMERIRPCCRGKGRGRPAREPEMLLRMVLLQQWYGLSFAACEEAVMDSYAMRTFVGVDFIRDSVPDASTLARFRRTLCANGLLGELEGDLHARLKRKGLGIRRAGGDVFLVKTGGAKG